MELISTRVEWRALLAARRAEGETVGLVPTMGALHEGHLSLVAEARARTSFVALTLFVNPLQFGEAADLASYPRDLGADLAAAERAGVGAVFAPSVAEMYPGGPPSTTVHPGPLAAGLEGRSRPGHFEGVATVVTKLFALAGPCTALFGEKDFQQLAIVRRLVDDLDLPVEVVGCPIVREPDGLALSSRNVRLTPAHRAAAPILYEGLRAGAALVEAGETDPAAVEAAMTAVVGSEERAALDYAVVADPVDLARPALIDGEVRLLVAARFGPVRLIDNLAATSSRPAAGSR